MADHARAQNGYRPLVLLANADKWFVDSLESVLTQDGYRVATATRRADLLLRARELVPDAVLLDLGLERRGVPRAPADGFELCRTLRADPAISPATPIILTTAGPALRPQQLDALRAGAWELRGEPLDTEELLLRLRAYTGGKREIDRVTAEGLVDRSTGLYNEAGVTRRSNELAAFVARHEMPLTCAVFRPAHPLPPVATGDRLAMAFKRAGRVSDAIGRTGPAEFTVFAAATDGEGAERLVERLTDMVARATSIRLKAGVSAAHEVSLAHPASPAALLERARAAID